MVSESIKYWKLHKKEKYFLITLILQQQFPTFVAWQPGGAGGEPGCMSGRLGCMHASTQLNLCKLSCACAHVLRPASHLAWLWIGHSPVVGHDPGVGTPVLQQKWTALFFWRLHSLRRRKSETICRVRYSRWLLWWKFYLVFFFFGESHTLLFLTVSSGDTHTTLWVAMVCCCKICSLGNDLWMAYNLKESHASDIL